MQGKNLVITAADAKFFDLVKGTILSIRDKPQARDISIACLDLGFTAEQVQWLRSKVEFVVQPRWHYQFSTPVNIPEYCKGQFVRPFLRQYFPQFDVYIWLDADAWVQDWSAMDLVVQGACRKGLAIVPELDRGYMVQYGRLPQWWKFVHEWYRKAFGDQAAAQLHSIPMLNTGVWALHKEAPHWEPWMKALALGLGNAVKHPGSFALHMVEQLALNVVVHTQGLFNRTELLPAWCNWTCHFNPPAWDERASRFVEPYLPNHPIGVMHLSGVHNKPQACKIRTVEGKTMDLNLRYPVAANATEGAV